MISRKKDLARVAKREKTFSTLAKKEEKGAKLRLSREKKANMKESAKDTKWEVGVDDMFAKVRSKISKLAKRKAK